MRNIVLWAFCKLPLLPEWLLWRMARYLNRTMVIPKPGEPGYDLYYSFLPDDLKLKEP